MIHRAAVPFVACLALLLAACGGPAAKTPQQALGEDVSRSQPADAESSGKSADATPAATVDSTDHWAAAIAAASNTAASAKGAATAAAPTLDTSSAQRMADTMRAIDASLNSEQKKYLRASLMVYTLRMQSKVAQIAQTYPKEHPPQFSDDQLMQMAYGQLNGLTGPEIIVAGHELAQQFPPGYFDQQPGATPGGLGGGATSPGP
jgi:hypothetical protein